MDGINFSWWRVIYHLRIFNPSTDKSIEDVFKRADMEMYENKQNMKAARE